ncbi:MAG: glycosyltransferase family 39 protein [Myxococcota bacterium]|nr:glycosyltransferase family 39 protein [Myxococcota bacterium]
MHSPTFDAPEGGDSAFFDRIAAGAPLPERAYFHSPLYHFFLGSVYRIVGRDLWTVRLIQHILGALTAVLVYLTALRLFERHAIAAIAGVAHGWIGPIIFYEGQLLIDAILPFLIGLFGFVITFDIASKKRRWLTIWIGLVIGIAALGRATVLIWLPLLVVWMMRRSRAGAAWFNPLLCVIGVILAIMPVTLRNYLVEGELVPITANFGLNLYIGNNPNATGTYNLPRELWFRPGDPSDDFSGRKAGRLALGRDPSSSELSAWWSGKALEYTAESPGRTAWLALWKMRLMLSDYEHPQLYNYYAYQRVAPILKILPTTGFIIAPALIGLALACLGGRVSNARGHAQCALLYILAFMPFFVAGRYRAPWITLLAPYAAWIIWMLVSAAWRRERLLLASLILALCISGVVSFIPISQKLSLAPQYNAFASAALKQNLLEQSTTWTRLALSENPSDARAYTILGRTLLSGSQFSKARDAMAQAAQILPQDAAIHHLLGVSQRHLGQLSKAERTLRRAVALGPGNVKAWIALGRVLELRQNTDKAIQAYESALVLIDHASADAEFIRERLKTLQNLRAN